MYQTDQNHFPGVSWVEQNGVYTKGTTDDCVLF